MSRRNEVVVGLVMIASIALVFFGTVWLRGAQLGREEMTIHARFLEIGQLQEGNAVKLRGVPIGRVNQIALEEGGQGVIVTARVVSDIRLPENPVMLLAPESLFGDWQAEIFPRNRFPDYEYTEPRRAGVLPGYSLPDISRLTAVADQIAANLAVLTDRVELAFTQETAFRIRDAIENIQALSAQLTSLVERQERTIQGLTESIGETAITAQQAAEAVQRIAAQVERAVDEGEVETIVGNLQRASAQIDSLTAAWVVVSANLSSAAVAADTTLTSFARVAQLASTGEGTLGLLLHDTLLYAQLVQTNAQVQALLEDIRANPRKYINLSVF